MQINIGDLVFGRVDGIGCIVDVLDTVHNKYKIAYANGYEEWQDERGVKNLVNQLNDAVERNAYDVFGRAEY